MIMIMHMHVVSIKEKYKTIQKRNIKVVGKVVKTVMK